MDIQMPIMDGYEATREIKKINNEVPIIALTANVMHKDSEKTKAVGMQEHLNKPIKVDKLYSTLSKYLSKNDNIIIKTSDEIKFPDFKHIDVNIGLTHMANNRKLYVKIMNSFYNSYKDFTLDDLNQEEKKIALHTLKGLSANIGAIDLNNIVKDMEFNNKDHLAKLYNEIKNVINDLKQLSTINKSFTYEKNPLTTKKKKELIENLELALKSKRPKDIEKVIEEIRKYQFSIKEKGN